MEMNKAFMGVHQLVSQFSISEVLKLHGKLQVEPLKLMNLVIVQQFLIRLKTCRYLKKSCILVWMSTLTISKDLRLEITNKINRHTVMHYLYRTQQMTRRVGILLKQMVMHGISLIKWEADQSDSISEWAKVLAGEQHNMVQ